MGRSEKSSTPFSANLTPLIDVTFLLIVFFVLVSQITNSRIADEIILPKPEHAVSQSDEALDETHLALNVIPDSENHGEVIAYRLGTHNYPPTPQGWADMIREMKIALHEQPNMILDFRADELTPYDRIFPALKAARAAGVHRLNLRVRPDENRAHKRKP